MITLIGTSTSCIGFGLCGIQDIVEVRRDETEKIITAAKRTKNEVIMIDEELYRKVRASLPKEKFYIKIPFRYREEHGFEDEIEEIIKETTG
ncbi:MAG: V-type ATP synthase subunit F [Nanobdellota archaeon]